MKSGERARNTLIPSPGMPGEGESAHVRIFAGSGSHPLIANQLQLMPVFVIEMIWLVPAQSHQPLEEFLRFLGNVLARLALADAPGELVVHLARHLQRFFAAVLAD